MKKYKKISSEKNNKKVKKLLVLPKSGGIEDLFQSFKNKKNDDLIFYWIPRKFLKSIHAYYFKDESIRDYFTIKKGSKFKYNKKIYFESLIEIFSNLKRFINLDCIISFNIFYYSEKFLDKVCKKLNIKFIIMHKESTFTPAEEITARYIYQNYNDKSIASKVSVYSKSQKNILIKSKLLDDEQIVVNGCPRSDYAFKLRTIKPKDNIIVYFLIEKKRSSNLLLKKAKNNWNGLHDKTLDFLLEFAKSNPNIKLILKGKTGVHNNLLKNKKLTKNCIFINGGTGEKLLKDAKVVVAFNSTIIFEAIAANRNLLIPNFNNENKRKKRFTYRIKNSIYFCNSKLIFFKKLKYYLNLSYENKKLNNKEKVLLNYYLGNIDGKSGKRLEYFLRKSINQ